jgi:hypothetical protein
MPDLLPVVRVSIDDMRGEPRVITPPLPRDRRPSLGRLPHHRAGAFHGCDDRRLAAVTRAGAGADSWTTSRRIDVQRMRRHCCPSQRRRSPPPPTIRGLAIGAAHAVSDRGRSSRALDTRLSQSAPTVKRGRYASGGLVLRRGDVALVADLEARARRECDPCGRLNPAANVAARHNMTTLCESAYTSTRELPQIDPV